MLYGDGKFRIPAHTSSPLPVPRPNRRTIAPKENDNHRCVKGLEDRADVVVMDLESPVAKPVSNQDLVG